MWLISRIRQHLKRKSRLYDRIKYPMKTVVIIFFAAVLLIPMTAFLGSHISNNAGKPVPMGGDAYRVEGSSCRSTWWKVRVLMGEKKAYGVHVLDEIKDEKGYHLLVELQILK